MDSEATMICIDNSECMRNGDYAPTRFQAQADAVSLLCGAKIQSNPENTVGLITMAGERARVLVNPISDLGKILACLHGVEIGGELNLKSAIKIAQLSLKNHQNRYQWQRIVVFAGSPIKDEMHSLRCLGAQLRRLVPVALDVVEFGESDADNSHKLAALVKNRHNSHIVSIPPGPSPLSDALLSTPIFTGYGGRVRYH